LATPQSLSRILAACVAAIIAALGMTPAPASGDAASPDPPSDSRAAQLQDLNVVRTEYLPKEMAFSPAARALAQAQLDKLERQAGSLSPEQFAVGLALLGGLADNAHSGLRRFDARVQPVSRLPLHLLWFPDALIIARATGAAASLAGARVIRIEGRSPEALFADAKGLLGGSPSGRKHWLNEWLESAGILHALGLAASPDRLSMTLRLPDGSVVERVIEMVPTAELTPTAERARLWSPEPMPGEHDWATAIRTQGLPLYLREADRPFRAVALSALKALYVQFRSNEDEDGFPIQTFLDSVRAKVAATHPTRLIVDLRFDVGGNLLTTIDFMRRLPGSVSGRTYLLVGPYTFSAGIISAAAIKKSGGAQVTVVGDTLGDRLHFWSEGNTIELPNSHYTFRYTDGQFNLKDGCTGEPACMDDRYPINVNFAPLEPDLRAPLTAAAYFALRDPAMEAVAAGIARAMDSVKGGRP
jgi:hypothetical protein